METVPRDVMTELSSGGASVATARLHFKPVYGPIEFAPSLHLEAPLRVRLGLQQRAVTNLHNHVLRAVRRFAVLLVADLASFYVMREVVRVVRDYASFGDSLAGQLEGVLPHGILNGWQYAVALFVALFLTGNYGRGDQRRDPRRLLIACALATALHRTGAEVVVVAGYLPDNRFREVVAASLEAESQLLSVPRSIAIAGVQPNLVWRRGQPLIELTAPNLKGWQVFVKRLLDVLGAGLGLVVLSPLLALVAAMVKLESRGPVFFTQVRVGQGGRRFRIVKFRTMVDGAEQRRDELLSRSLYNDGRLFKVRDDPRITPLGRWLRRTSIDELPQLVNVLRGEMSLVGPRPPLPSEVALYEEHHYARFDVKPGITGPWQVAGRNGVTSFEEVLGLERNYIRGWSVWSDVRLLAKTIPVVVRMRGAF